MAQPAHMARPVSFTGALLGSLETQVGLMDCYRCFVYDVAGIFASGQESL